MRRSRKFVSIFLVIAMLFVSNSYATIKEIEDNSSSKIEYSAFINGNYNKCFNTKDKDQRNYKITQIDCSINNLVNSKEATGNLSMVVNNKIVSTNVIGTIEYFSQKNGYVGVLDGFALIDNVVESITLDFMYINKNNNFTALTIGCAGDILPQIVFLGEYTDELSELSTLNTNKILAEKNDDVLLDSYTELSETNNSVDATTRFQATSTKVVSGYETVTISLYHADELRNQSSMSVYAKVNSHSDSFKEYLKDVHGYDASQSSLIVYPDSYMIEVVGADKFLHSNGFVSPTAGTTSQTMTFPAYLPYVGFFTFGVPITMTSTTVDFRGVAVNAIYDDNIITWNIYKRYGWSQSTLDGYYDDAAGGIVRAGFTYESDVTSNITSTMGAYGQIRYEYVYTPFLASPITLHMWTDKVLCVDDFTIVP
ncbi:MAG: hypothetical protein ACI4QZ_02910 [Eubacteriales bacterium]